MLGYYCKNNYLERDEYRMLYMILFTIIGGGVASILARLLYKKFRGGNKIHYVPYIFGVINLLLSSLFMIWFIVNPDAFSSDAVIESQVVYVLFTIFATYFYICALPISIGCITLSYYMIRNKEISESKFYLSVCLNGFSIILLFVITYLVNSLY